MFHRSSFQSLQSVAWINVHSGLPLKTELSSQSLKDHTSFGNMFGFCTNSKHSHLKTSYIRYESLKNQLPWVLVWDGLILLGPWYELGSESMMISRCLTRFGLMLLELSSSVLLILEILLLEFKCTVSSLVWEASKKVGGVVRSAESWVSVCHHLSGGGRRLSSCAGVKYRYWSRVGIGSILIRRYWYYALAGNFSVCPKRTQQSRCLWLGLLVCWVFFINFI